MQLTKMLKYDAYKDSGVEWLGEIPEDWSVDKLKYNASIDTGNSISDNKKSKYESIEQDSYPYVSTKDVNYEYSTINYNNGLAIPRTEKKFKVSRSGSTLLCIEGGSAGRKIAFNDRDICYVNKLASISPLEQNVSKFIYFLITSNVFKEQFFLSMNGLIGGVSISVINNFVLPTPPTHEQTLIAKFLDQKTAQIDKAIEIKHKQIALLKEQKQIVTNNAVTKGLDPNAPMKDSGIEWIGEIPEGWEVRKAKYIFFEVDERSKNGNEELLSVSHTTGVTPRSEKSVNMFLSEDYTGSKTCSKNDLVINIMWAWMGALGVSDRNGIISSSYGVYRQKFNTFNPIYLEYLLKTNKYIEEYNRRSTGLHSSRLRLYSDMFFDMELGFPHIKEQQQIVAYIEEKTSKIDKAIELQNKQIDKLKEYKASVINSVVTGKARVTDEMVE